MGKRTYKPTGIKVSHKTNPRKYNQIYHEKVRKPKVRKRKKKK